MSLPLNFFESSLDSEHIYPPYSNNNNYNSERENFPLYYSNNPILFNFDMMPQELLDEIPSEENRELESKEKEKISPLFEEEANGTLIPKKHGHGSSKLNDEDFFPVITPYNKPIGNLEIAQKVQISDQFQKDILNYGEPIKNHKRKKYNEREIMAFIKLNKTGENKDGLVKFNKEKIRFEQIRKSYKVCKNDSIRTIIPNSSLIQEEPLNDESVNAISFYLNKYENEYSTYPPLVQMADHYGNKSATNNTGLLINKGSTLRIGKFYYDFLSYIPDVATQIYLFEEQLQFINEESNIINQGKVKKHEELNDNSKINNEDACKFCLSGSTSENPLISICKCCGSSKYYHFDCLKKWIDIKMLQEKFPNSWSFYWNKMRCESCKADYPFFVRINNKIKPLFTINFPKSGSIILLKSVFPNKKDFFAIHMIIFQPTEKLLSIGNIQQNHCVIKDYSIGKDHCFIFIDKGNLYFYDNYSEFGAGIVIKNHLRLDLDKKYKFEQKGSIYRILISKKKEIISKEKKKIIEEI